MFDYYIFGRGELCIFTIDYLLKNEKSVTFIPDRPEPEWQESVVDFCMRKNVKIIEFNEIHENIEDNSIGMSVYFRKIFKNDLIQQFNYFVNLHNAPLPKYRGVNPINWALKNEEPIHGVTLHHIDEGIDTGDIIDQEIFDINKNLEVIDVYRLCIEAGKKVIERSLLNIDSINSLIQDESKSSYYSNDDFEKLGNRKYFRRD